MTGASTESQTTSDAPAGNGADWTVRLGELKEAGRVRQATELVDEAIERGDNADDVRALVAAVVDAMLEAKDGRGAERAVARAERAYPDDVGFTRMRGDLLENDGRPGEAVAIWEKLTTKLQSDADKAALWERMGDLAKDVLSRPQDALRHYQSAFRADRERRTAIRKAALLYLEESREEQAKQLLDLEAELLAHMAPRPEGLAEEIAELYTRVAESLVMRPPAHDAARSALDKALALVPGDERATELMNELTTFADKWKEHVRALRDTALSSRDKRDAARNYLAIAQIYRTYDPDDDKQVQNNVDKCLMLAPGYRPALKFLESIYRERGQMDQFLERLKKQAKTIRKADAAVDLWMFIAVLLGEQGASSEDLAAAYEEVRKKDPKNLGAISALTELHLEGGRFEDAAKVMEDFLSHTTDIAAKRSTLRQLARIYEVELGSRGKAAESLEQLRELGGDDEVLLQLAELYRGLNDDARLAATLEHIFDSPAAKDFDGQGPKGVLDRLIEIYDESLDEPSKAFDARRRLFALDPVGALEEHLDRQADQLARPGDLAETYAQVAAQSVADPIEQRRLKLKSAELFVRAGQVKRARVLLDELLAKDPKDPDALAALDTILERDAGPEELVEVLESRLKTQQAPHERVPTLLSLADAYGRLRKSKELIARLTEVVELEPKHADALAKLDEALRTAEAYPDLAGVLERRSRLAAEQGDTDESIKISLRLAQLFDERLGREVDAARIYLNVHNQAGERPDVLRALEKLLARGVLATDIAEALQPYYAQANSWRRHVEMIQIRRDAEEDPSRRAALSKAMAGVFEEKLRSPRDAFDAWGAALLDEPDSSDAVSELERLAEVADAHAVFAELIDKAAERLPDGPPKNALLSRRASLLQGVLGDQAAAIEAHQQLLETDPSNVGSLDALIDIYEKRQAWPELRQVLTQRVEVTSEEEVAPLAAQLGTLLVERFGESAAGAGQLDVALHGEGTLKGTLKQSALRAMVTARKALHAEDANEETTQALADALKELGESLAGPERAEARVEYGDLLRTGLGKHADALSAYEAALANDPENTGAEAGVRAILDDASAETSLRRSSARALSSRYAAAENHAGRAHVLHALLSFETEPKQRRQLVKELSQLFVEELEEIDEALTLLLEHLVQDPADATARQDAEALAFASGQTGTLFTTFEQLRQLEDTDLAHLYAERLADVALKGGDLERASEALEHLTAVRAEDPAVWDRLREVYDQKNDGEGVARCLLKLAELSDTDARVQRLVALSDYHFEVLEDVERGLDALRMARQTAPSNDTVLARLESRLEQNQRYEELAEVLGARAELAGNPADTAALLLEQGELLLEALGRAEDAVKALTLSLEAERDGNSTAKVGELLQEIARRDDQVGIIALDAIVDHHRAQQAWQPLVESLEIAAEKRPAGEERATLLDEVAHLYEEALRTPALAFREACRAFRDAPTPERDKRVHELADATGSFGELMGVLEDVAEALRASDAERATELYREVCQLASQRLDDQESTVRAAEAILQLHPGDKQALGILEQIHRGDEDRERLIAVLERRAASTEDSAERHKTLLELGRLLVEREDPDRAEAAFRQVAHEDTSNDTALALLDELYARTGNSAAHVDILERRIALREDDATARASLRVRLAMLLLQRRGDPAGAHDTLKTALGDSPTSPEVRQALEALVEHARQHGAPPLAQAAHLLEHSLRAQEDWESLPKVVEMRLLGETDTASRAALMLEVAQLQEEKLEQPDFAFMWVSKAMQELPEDESLRADAERLATQTDNLDLLKDLYEDIVEEVSDVTLKSHLNRRIAQLAESEGGDTTEARQRLQAAVEGGAQDVETLQNLVRLTRMSGDAAEHASALSKLAESAVLEVKPEIAKEAYAELADVMENLGNLGGAIRAAKEMLTLDASDTIGRATMERLLQRAERWEDLAAFLLDTAEKEEEDEGRAAVLARLCKVQIENLGVPEEAITTLEQIASLHAESPEAITLGGQLLHSLSSDGSPEAVKWRGRVAVLMEPRYESDGRFDQLVHILRLRLEALDDVEERKALWLRIVELWEKVLEQPEQAFIAIGRALSESPGDSSLREKAERLSVQLGDIETLIGLYDDLRESLAHDDVENRLTYALRNAELYEGSVGDPSRATEYYERALDLLANEGEEGEQKRELLERTDRLYRALGDPERLAKTLTRRADLLPEDQEDRAKVARQLLYEAATIQMHGMNDYAGAITSLKRLLQSSPDDLPALRALQEACKREEQWSDLAEALERELGIVDAADARALEARYELGVVLDARLNLPDDALAHFQGILESAPEHAATREYLETRLAQRETMKLDNAEFLQRSYERTGDWQKAVDVMRQQVAEHEKREESEEAAALLLRIGEIQADNLPGQEALAFGTLCAALRHDPQNASVRARLFQISEEYELLEDLIDVYEEEATTQDAAGRNAAAAELREVAARLWADALGDIDKAIEAYEIILEKHAGRGEATDRLTEFYGKAGRWDELEQILKKRLMFLDDPEDRAPLLLPLAQALADHLDRPEEAVPLLMELRRIDADNVDARRLLIELNDAAGDLDQLRPLLEEELAHSREAEDQEGVVFARGRLAVLLADQVGDIEGAIPLWEEIHAQEPENPAALSALERLYSETEKWAELRTLYERLLERTNDHQLKSELTLKLGRLLSDKLGSAEEAVQRHLKILEVDPRNDASLNALRQLYRAVGQWDDLVALLRRMMRFQTDAQQLKSLRFDLAEVLGMHLDRRAESIEMGRRILDIEPHTPEELERLGHVFRHNQAWEELAGVLERHAGLLGEQARVQKLAELAEVHETHLGRGEASAPAYENILQTDPSNERAYQRLCEIYEKAGDFAKLAQLKQMRERVVTETSEKVGLLREIGRLQEERLGAKEMAFMTAVRAFQLDWTDRELAGWMDRLSIETDTVEAAIEVYDEAIGELEDEERIIETHIRMAELSWDQLEESDEAETHLKRVLEYDADNEKALLTLVRIFEAQERWQDAVDVLEQRAKHADDRDVRIERLRGIALVLDEKAQDADGAIQAHKRILELDGTDITALKSLAELYERLDQHSQLIAILERIEEQTEELEGRLAVRARIASIWENDLENDEQAVLVHKSILADDAGYQTSLKALERLHTGLGQSDDLIGVFEQMLTQTDDPDEQVRLLAKIATTWEESFDDVEKAVLANERILAIDPKNLGAIRSLQRLFRNTGEWDSLIEQLEHNVTLSEDPQEIIKLYLEIGEVYHRELGKTDKAEAAYNAALDFDPGSREALHSLGQLYERSGNWQYALEKLQQEAELAGGTPEAVEIQYRIGKINEEMLLDFDAARSAYEQSLDLDPRYIPAIRALKEIAHNEKDNDQYLRWLKTEAQYTDDEEEKTELHTTAGTFLQEELSDLDAAAEEYESALAVTFDHLEAARPLADICFSNENWERAEQLLDIIVDRLDPNEDAHDLCRLHYRLGYVCEKVDKEQKALKNYQRAYEIDATYLPGLEGLGAALSRNERWEDAAKIYQAILIHHREFLTDAEVVDYYQQLAQLYHRLGDPDRAIKNLNKALELDSSHGPSLRLMGDVYLDGRLYEDAYDALMRLVPLEAGDARVSLLIEIGKMCNEQLHDAYRAIDAYEDANRQQPQNREVLEALLELYKTTKQGGRAVEVLEEIVRIEPDEKARVRLNQELGEVYRDELKNEARAVQYFNAALDLDPTYIKAFQAIETLLSTNKNWKGLEENYIRMLQRLPQGKDSIKRELWKNLAGVYRYRLKNAEGAAQAYTVLHKMDPDDVETLEALADLLSRIPQKVDEAIQAYQKLVPLVADRPQRAFHALVRLYHNRRMPDRAFLTCAALKVIGDLLPDEAKLYGHYLKRQPPEPKAALTAKLWEGALVHPQARGPLLEMSKVLWNAAGPQLARNVKEFGLEKKKLWVRQDLEAPVPTFFVTQLKKVRSALGLGQFEVFVQRAAAEPPQVLPIASPVLIVGESNEAFRGGIPEQQLRFLCARQVAYFRPGFVLPRVIGAQKFQALIEAAIRVVEPRYTARSDPRIVTEYEKLLQRMGPPLVQAIRGYVGQLLKKREAVNVKPFLEGVEYTTLRAAYVVTGNLEQAAQLLRLPDPAPLPLPYGQKIKEMVQFAVSEPNFELRTRIGMATQG